MRIGSAHLWVHDQEVALKFWTEKVGMEVRQDVSFPDVDGIFRWLTVGPPGQDDVDRPDGGAGRAGDGRAHQEAGSRPHRQRLRRHRLPDHRRLPREPTTNSTARGVEFTEEPHEMPYGIDCGLSGSVGQ